MSLSRTDAVIFDVDGTLVDYEHAQREGLRRHLKDQGWGHDASGWERWCRAEERHFARYLAGDLTFEDQRRERVREFVGEPLPDDDADTWFDSYRAHFESCWRLFDDVVGSLDALADRPLAAFSNVSGAYTRRKVSAVGLQDRFALVWGIDDVGAAKPAPRVFLDLCATLGVDPSRTLHVGDRYEADALGACDAGLLSLWLDRPGASLSGRRPDGAVDPRVTVVTSLTDLVALLDQ